MLDNPSRYEVEPLVMANSIDDDFAPSFVSDDYDQIYFSSSRKGGLSKNIDGRTGSYFYDLWSIKWDKKRKNWSAPTLLPEGMNTPAHEAGSSFNDRGNEMYFLLGVKKVQKKNQFQLVKYIFPRKKVRLDFSCAFAPTI